MQQLPAIKIPVYEKQRRFKTLMDDDQDGDTNTAIVVVVFKGVFAIEKLKTNFLCWHAIE